MINDIVIYILMTIVIIGALFFVTHGALYRLKQKEVVINNVSFCLRECIYIAHYEVCILRLPLFKQIYLYCEPLNCFIGVYFKWGMVPLHQITIEHPDRMAAIIAKINKTKLTQFFTGKEKYFYQNFSIGNGFSMFMQDFFGWRAQASNTAERCCKMLIGFSSLYLAIQTIAWLQLVNTGMVSLCLIMLLTFVYDFVLSNIIHVGLERVENRKNKLI